MSDFTRSRGCGAPLFTAADETSLRSSCAIDDECRSCGCESACSCGGTSGRSSGCGCGCNGSASSNGNGSANSNGGGSSNTEGCTCCKASMRQAMRLLCSNRISDQLDFDGFAFVTDDLIVGARPTHMSCDRKDNLKDLDGTFRRFSPCNCDLIDIEGRAFGPFGCLIDVDQATLCSLSAIVFQVRGAEGRRGDDDDDDRGDDRDCDRDHDRDCDRDRDCGRDRDRDRDCDCSCVERRFRRVRDLLQCELNTFDRTCGECVCHCDCTDDCCCAEGVLAALSGLSLNKRATLIAGLLALRNVTVLGTIGNVLVLSNEEEHRFYFVCANKVEMLA